MAEEKLFLENDFAKSDNINQLINKHFSGEIGLLSIDIDGYDYEVWKAIDCVSPRILILEYNSTYPPPVKWHIPYDKAYFWAGDNYFGMTLSDAVALSNSKGYILVGTDLQGINAFFIRKDIFESCKDRFPYLLDEKSLYNFPNYHLLPYFTGHRNSMRYPYMYQNEDA